MYSASEFPKLWFFIYNSNSSKGQPQVAHNLKLDSSFWRVFDVCLSTKGPTLGQLDQ